MDNVFDVLKERGFIEQVTHEEELRELLGKEKITFYIGFDPTADSLHAGHFVAIMAMSHMQKHGHQPIALCGGGTGMVGDPSGKADMRKMMTVETIDHNVSCFQKQLSRFLDFGPDKAIMANNGDWLLALNYVDFLREIGAHFSVNRMIAAEAFKIRMEREIGLTFLEFNYMIMQSYDFLQLYKRYGCKLQMGGNDQWSNIISGADLIRRMESKPAYGLTLKLLTTSAGEKMGKTVSGALWLDPDKTSPYEFYQYWRNVADPDVYKCLALLTFLPMDEVKRLGSLKGSAINEAKKVLAYEVTKNVHGAEEAEKAQKAAVAIFQGGAMEGSIPETIISISEFGAGMNIIDLMDRCGLIASKSEGRRLIAQGGVRLNEAKVGDIALMVTQSHLTDGIATIQKGKKIFHQVRVQ